MTSDAVRDKIRAAAKRRYENPAERERTAAAIRAGIAAKPANQVRRAEATRDSAAKRWATRRAHAAAEHAP